jgi:hypothetical protein
MSQARQQRNSTPLGRRYLVHLSCSGEDGGENVRYIARIRPWSARSSSHTETQERVFADECELIESINPLLPQGSDVRDVFEHVESSKGFFYILHLSNEEAARLGWRREMASDGAG